MLIFDSDGVEIPAVAIAHDIAARDWADADGILGARLPRGRRIYSSVTYYRGALVRMMSLQDGDQHAHVRYVHPDTKLVLVRNERGPTPPYR